MKTAREAFDEQRKEKREREARAAEAQTPPQPEPQQERPDDLVAEARRSVEQERAEMKAKLQAALDALR